MSYRFGSELLVNRAVSPPVIRDECRSVGHRVEERPEGAVTAAIVVRVKDGRLHVHGHHLSER